MDGPEFIWVHLNHACDEIDVWHVTQPEEARAATGQGYIPLTKLRQLKASLDSARAIMQKFVDKVDSGRARSKETYAEMKEWLDD